MVACILLALRVATGRAAHCQSHRCPTVLQVEIGAECRDVGCCTDTAEGGNPDAYCYSPSTSYDATMCGVKPSPGGQRAGAMGCCQQTPSCACAAGQHHWHTSAPHLQTCTCPARTGRATTRMAGCAVARTLPPSPT